MDFCFSSLVKDIVRGRLLGSVLLSACVTDCLAGYYYRGGSNLSMVRQLTQVFFFARICTDLVDSMVIGVFVEAVFLDCVVHGFCVGFSLCLSWKDSGLTSLSLWSTFWRHGVNGWSNLIVNLSGFLFSDRGVFIQGVMTLLCEAGREWWPLYIRKSLMAVAWAGLLIWTGSFVLRLSSLRLGAEDELSLWISEVVLRGVLDPAFAVRYRALSCFGVCLLRGMDPRTSRVVLALLNFIAL